MFAASFRAGIMTDSRLSDSAGVESQEEFPAPPSSKGGLSFSVQDADEDRAGIRQRRRKPEAQ